MFRVCLKLCKHKTTKTLLIAKIGVGGEEKKPRAEALGMVINKGNKRL